MNNIVSALDKIMYVSMLHLRRRYDKRTVLGLSQKSRGKDVMMIIVMKKSKEGVLHTVPADNHPLGLYTRIDPRFPPPQHCPTTHTHTRAMKKTRSDKIFRYVKTKLRNMSAYSKQMFIINAKLNVSYVINVRILPYFVGYFTTLSVARLHSV
jgi:hypothetical protein